MLPPGDLRMALAALCGDDDWGQTWAEVLQHRFAGEGDMRGHVVGNLLIVSLWEQLGDHVAALDWVGRLLGASGRVLPMALTPLVMTAQVRGADPAAPNAVTTVRGQVEVATSAGTIQSVALEPADPPPCPEAVDAVRDGRLGGARARVVVHLRDPAPAGARAVPGRGRDPGRVVVVLNLAPQDGETPGSTPADHLAALLEHAPDLQRAHRAGRRPQRARPRRARGRRRGAPAPPRGGRHRRRRRLAAARPRSSSPRPTPT